MLNNGEVTNSMLMLEQERLSSNRRALRPVDLTSDYRRQYKRYLKIPLCVPQ